MSAIQMLLINYKINDFFRDMIIPDIFKGITHLYNLTIISAFKSLVHIKKLIRNNPLHCFCGIKCHTALNRNWGHGHNTCTLLLQLISGDLIVHVHIDSYTLPILLHSQAALPNSHPNACEPSKEASCTIFIRWSLV